MHLSPKKKMQTHIVQAHGIMANLMTQPVSVDSLEGEWRELLSRHARCVCALDRELEANHGLGMSEYEVLDRLASGVAKRVQELAATTHLSQSALSRTVARLERDGLVIRAMCPDDRRGVSVCLTPAGVERYEAARPTHRRVLQDNLPHRPEGDALASSG
jgi:DNA-binding MarR family transcriptional regulator